MARSTSNALKAIEERRKKQAERKNTNSQTSTSNKSSGVSSGGGETSSKREVSTQNALNTIKKRRENRSKASNTHKPGEDTFRALESNPFDKKTKTSILDKNYGVVDFSKRFRSDDVPWSPNYYNNIQDNEDFQEYVEKGKARTRTNIIPSKDSNFDKYTMGNRVEETRKGYDVSMHYDGAGGKVSQMTDDEVDRYSYLLAKYGYDEAEEYIRYLEDNLTNRLYERVKEENNKTEGGYKDSWFKTGDFSDGYNFGDATKTTLGTLGDLGVGAVKGVGRMVEGLVDLGTYGVAGVGGWFSDDFKEKTKNIARYSATDEWTKGVTDFLDKHSVLGNKFDGVSEGIGQVLAIMGTAGIAGAAGLSGAGVTAVTTGTMGASSMGTSMGEAYDSGATDLEAVIYGGGKGIVDAGTELVFGGLGKGVKALGISRGIGGFDDIFAKKLSSKLTKAITNEGIQRAVGNTIEFGVKSAGEGLEEVAAGYGSAIMKKLTYMSDEELKQLVEDEKLLDQFIVGTVTSSLVQSPSYINSTQKGTDFVTGLTPTQERVVDTLAENEFAEREKGGTKLTSREKNIIYNDLIKNLLEEGSSKSDAQQENNEPIEGDTLEKAAMDVVANRNTTQTSKTEPGSNIPNVDDSLPIQEGNELKTENRPHIEEKTIKIRERLEVQSQNNEPITVEDVKKVTGFGDEGAKIVTELANSDGVTFGQAENAVKAAYIAGHTGIEGTSVSFSTDTQINAFTAGKKDRVMQDMAMQERAKTATVYDGAFTDNENTKNFTKREKKMIATVAKALKMDISTVDEILASKTYDENGEEVKHYANAKHIDGKMEIASNRDVNKAIYSLIMHEGGHRMRQLAPSEFGVLMNALYKRADGRNLKLGVSRGMAFDKVKNLHDNAGITMTTDGYIEEVAVRELETIFSSEREFIKWYEEISGDKTLRTNFERFIDWVLEVIDDVKRALKNAKLSKEERAKAKETLAELDRIKNLLASTFKAAENAATERAKEGRTQNTDTKSGTDKTDVGLIGSSNYSLKEENKKTIEFLENQEHITTYKAMQLINGKLYPPMAAKTRGEDGKYHLTNPSELGSWQRAVEDPTNIKFNDKGVGYYVLNKGDGSSVTAAYNPYEHSSNLVLNDQFEGAYKRDNLVTVECVIPKSEITSGYKAKYAKDTTGVLDWKSGVVAGKIKNNKRMVYLSRWLKPVRILTDAETASLYKEALGDSNVSVPFNVVTPSLLTELEKLGVPIDREGSPMYRSNKERNKTKREANYSLKDSDYLKAVESGDMETAPTSNPDTRFSLKESVEETRDLIAVHNASEQQLIDALSRGSFVMPSMAVTNKAHTSFGDISVVFYKESINPEINKDNKLYGADAWTPTQTTLKINPQFDNQKTESAVKSVKQYIGKNWSQIFDVNSVMFKKAIKSAKGSLYNAYSENIGMQTAYAKKEGIISSLPMKDGRVDVDALKNTLNEELNKDKVWRDYKNWLGEISNEIITSYDKASTQDILDNMKSQPETAKPFNLSENGELTVPAVEYNSIDEMRKNKGRLSENAEIETKAVGKEFVSWANSIGNKTSVNTKSVIKAINNSFDSKYDTKGIVKTFKNNGIAITINDAINLQALFKKAVELPTLYFEAKPQRTVGFEEVASVVLPNNANEGIKTSLEENGVAYTEYESGNTESRMEALNSIQGVRFSLKDSEGNTFEENEIDDAINQSMTMEQAKDMIQRAFVIGGIKEWFDGEYQNGDEWLKGEGADAVALVVENEWTLQQKFLDKIQDLNEEFFVADIIEAYEKGTLTGKVKQNVVKRLDVSKTTNATDTRVFAPKEIKNAQEVYKVALERVTNTNREKVNQARADIIMFAHNRGAAEALGLTQSELNKKLATWARYTARAKEVSMRINKDVALFNKWTGIENSNLLNRATVSQAELDNLVNEVKGDSNGWQRSYIMRTMLALDTHIDYSELNFEFVGTPKTSMGKSVNGFYDNSHRKIEVKYNAPHTVAHEMGHFIDYQWARDLGCGGALTDGFGRDKQTDADVKQFLTNFDEFIEQIENVADLRSEYTMDRKEVFARFVAKFVQWVDLVANGRRSYAQEYLSYNDKFTATQYIEFIRLLQEKSMIDSKRFNRREANVNFSLRETDNISTKDRKDLLDIIEHLKGEFELTKFAKADQKKLAKMTRDILKEYSSQANFDETLKAVDDLYTYMANGEDGHSAVWEEVYDRAYNIAQGIVENAVEVDNFAYQEYKHLRDYLRTTPMKFDAEYDSVPSAYENFNEFRKMNMGRLKFTKDGTGIDGVYQELAHLYPEFFDAEEQTNSADQLERIIDVLDELQPTEINPFDREIEQASMYLANDLTSRFFDIPQAKPTFADKAERRVVEAKIKGAKKVEAVRQQKDEKIRKLLESQKNKTKKLLEKAKESKVKAVDKEKAKRKDSLAKMSESQKAKVLRARILRHTSDLNKKLLNPTDNQHIPHELQGAVAKLLECINLESNYTYDTESHSYKKNDEGLPTRRTQAYNELKKVYADIASSVVVDPDLVGEYGLLSGVISLADKRIVDMTSSELETVWQSIRAIEASVNTANRIFSEGKFATILDIAETLRNDNTGKKSKTEYKGIIGKGKKLATLDMLTPETYLHYLGDAGDSVFRMMRDAQDKHISIMKEVADFTHKELKDVNVNKLEKKLHTVKLGGEDVQLSTAQLMELYVLMKRDQAVDHILVGGILPDVTKSKGLKLITKTKPIRNISVEEISKAISNLTDEQKKVADKLQKYVSSVLSSYGNEASMQVYNYEKFNEENYWTIRTNKQEITSDVEKDTSVTTVANKGMTKATKPHANTSVRIGSIFDTFASHSSDMATYAAWLGTSEDVNRIRNFVFWEDGARRGTVKDILDTVHGTQGSKYLEKLLTDVAIGVKGTDNMNPFDRLIGHYKAASVGANLRVIIQQPTAILRALDMIDARHFITGAGNPLKGWKKAKKYAPIAQWKDWGYFDINTGRQMKDVMFDNASLLEKTKQVGMWGASMADSVSWGQLWNAVESETKANNKELKVGSEEYYETVAKRFTEIVDHTQVVDGILQRSQVMRSADNLTKMATAFMGEPTKQFNMAISAYNDVITGKGDARKKAVGRLGRTAFSLATAGIINACAQSIIDAMRDDDKEEKYWERWLTAFVGDGDETKWYDTNLADAVNPLNYIPFAKDVVSILRGYDVKRMDTEAITKVFDASKNMYKAVTGTGKYTIAEASAQLFAEIARMYGVPVANVKRDVKSLVMATAIETDNYLMQYRIEKAMLDINYAGNSKNFMDILFNAYNNDREAYEFIYNDMIESGYDADKIQSGMETRQKKAEGVEKTSDLSKRYMSPEYEQEYDSMLDGVKSSKVWKSASEEQQKDVEADLYEILTSTSETTEETREKLDKYGIDETDYVLWNLAKEMADKPSESGEKGSYTNGELAVALSKMDVDDKTAWALYLSGNDTEKAREAKKYGIDAELYAKVTFDMGNIKADYIYNGKRVDGKNLTSKQKENAKVVSGSREEKIQIYLNSACDNYKEYLYFLGSEYKKYKDDRDYVSYFGK